MPVISRFFNNFVSLWLPWVFVAALELSGCDAGLRVTAAVPGLLSLQSTGSGVCRLQQLQCAGSVTGSQAPECKLSSATWA